MTAAARVVAAAEVGELPALRGGDEQLAGVRVRESRPCTPGGVGMLQLLDRAVRTVAAGDDTVPLEAERDVDRRESVQPPRELRGVDPGSREEVDLPGAVRGRHDDLPLEIGERLLQARRAPDRGLAVIGEEHDGVALEELVRPARRVEQGADRGVGLLERTVGRLAVRAGGVRGEVVAGEIEGEEVEAVARDEPAPDRSGVGVDRACASAAHRERRPRPVRLEQPVEEETRRPVGGSAHPGKGRQVAVAAAVARDVHGSRHEARRPRAPRRSSPRPARDGARSC